MTALAVLMHQVEGVTSRLHRRLVARQHKVGRAEAMAVLLLAGEWLISVTSAPMAAAIFTPMWPRPPRPTMPTRTPGPGPPLGQRLIAGDAGAQQRSGHVEPERSRHAQHVVLVNDDVRE